LLKPGVNTTYKVRLAALYSALELHFAIVAACVIPIKPLFDSFFNRKGPKGEFSSSGSANSGAIPDPWNSRTNVNAKDDKDKDTPYGALRRDDIGLEEMLASNVASTSTEDFDKVPLDGRWESTQSIIPSK
jgi:hypothetical protein